MGKLVMHKQVYRPGVFGGTLNTTLCGRLRSGKEMNVESQDGRVTCKFCLRVLEQQAIRKLHEAIASVPPLPRCKHGNCLEDHSGEKLVPECGCRL